MPEIKVDLDQPVVTDDSYKWSAIEEEELEADDDDLLQGYGRDPWTITVLAKWPNGDVTLIPFCGNSLYALWHELDVHANPYEAEIWAHDICEWMGDGIHHIETGNKSVHYVGNPFEKFGDAFCHAVYERLAENAPKD